MSLDIKLSKRRGSPIYRQISEQIRSMIVEGRLQSGTKLPPIRQFASEIGVSKLTVYQAYTELQEAGLVEATVGRGTIVSPKLNRQVGTQFLQSVTRSGPLNVFEVVSESIGLRSLATSVPDPEFFYNDEFLAEIYALRDDSPWLFYLGPHMGVSELLAELAVLLRQRGLPSTEAQIAVVNGVAHARALAVQAITSPGDVVLMEQPAELEADAGLKTCGVSVIRIPVEEDGLNIELLRKAAQSFAPRALVLWPNFGAVTGTMLSTAKRKEIIRLAIEFGFYIIENDGYGRLAYDNVPPAPLASLWDEQVIYIDGFCDTLAPGLRMGFVRAKPETRDRIAAIYRDRQLSGPLFLQVALARYLKNGRFQAHLGRVLPKYRARRNAMLGSLKFSMPPQVRWTYPSGGYSTFLTLPDGGRYQGLYEAALERGVAFAPGSLLMGTDEGDRHLRLSFGTQTPEAIQQAVETLSRLIEQRLPR